jgi:hypothetical protein
MKFAIQAIRAAAVALGLVAISISALNIGGIIPSSEEMPALRERIFDFLPTFIAGGLMVVPYRFVRTTIARTGIAIGLTIPILWLLWMARNGFVVYATRHSVWPIIPTALVPLVISVLNLWAFVVITGAPSAIRPPVTDAT